MNKTKTFPLFSRGTEFIDDSVMTVEVANALIKALGKSDEEIKAALVTSMRLYHCFKCKKDFGTPPI